jgi:hypothetical protein
MANERIGPHLHLAATCSGCKYERSERYQVQGDSGRDVYCDHPSQPNRLVADTRWDTPDWCPEGARMIEMRATLKQSEKRHGE